MRTLRNKQRALALTPIAFLGWVITGCDSSDSAIVVKTPKVDVEVEQRQPANEDRRERVRDLIKDVDVEVNNGKVKVDVNGGNRK